VGWLLLTLGLTESAEIVADGYGSYGLQARPGALPAAGLVALYNPATLAVGAACVGFVLLLTPTGSPPSPRRRWWARVAAAAPAVFVATMLLLPEPLDPAATGVDNPLAVAGLGGVLRVVNQVALGATLLAVVAAAGSLVGRLRRARGVERQQLRWVALAAPLVALMAAAIPTALAVKDLWLFEWAAGLSVVILPLAIGAAILRYRLYDLDQLITRAVAYGVLTVLITVVYLAVVVGLGAAIRSQGRGNVLLVIVATAVIAVAFQPARERSRRLANLLVYGRRATPYEVLSEFARGLTGASTDDSLLRLARLVVEATGVAEATVWLRLGGQLQPHASWPQTRPLPEPVALDGRSVEAALAMPGSRTRSFPVQHEDGLLGALTVTVSPAEPLTPASEKLIADLAAQTGLGLRFEHMKERALFARALASFLPPEVAELVEASPSALSLREEVEATILFSDIRGFSTLAERLPPRKVAEVVGRHLAAMAEVVTAHGGVLDKFAGDAVMAVFGAPRPVTDHARRALGCAVAMQQRQVALNDDAAQAGLPRFAIGIGVNSGTVTAGTIGGVGRLDYTVLGDAVNVAQRLQSEAMGGEILASGATVAQAGPEGAEPVGSKHLKGRQELVEAYRIHWAATSAAHPSGGSALAQ
jgi:class 3 adenylate cyclase